MPIRRTNCSEYIPVPWWSWSIDWHVPLRTRTYALTSHAQVRDAGLGLTSPIGQAHAIIANAPEALALTGAMAPVVAALALARTFDTAVVTLGEAGALAASSGQLVQAPAPRVNVKDATGAGDLFAAGYIWADLRGVRSRTACAGPRSTHRCR